MFPSKLQRNVYGPINKGVQNHLIAVMYLWNSEELLSSELIVLHHFIKSIFLQYYKFMSQLQCFFHCQVSYFGFCYSGSWSFAISIRTKITSYISLIMILAHCCYIIHKIVVVNNMNLCVLSLGSLSFSSACMIKLIQLYN